MKNFFALSLLLVLIPVFNQSFAQKWVTFNIADANFQLDGPPKSDLKTDKTEEGNTTSISFTIEGQVYMGSAVEHKTNLTENNISPKSLAKTSLDAVIEAFSGTNVVAESYFVNKVEGMQATMNKDGYENPIHYKVVIVGQIQYQLIVMKKEGALDKKGMKKFFKSFKVTK